jgi:glycosyltransferase involved in cell wall biosynthesis
MSTEAVPARVLIVSALQVHPALSGGNLRTHALADALARRGAEVFVYSFVGRKKDYIARSGSGLQNWPSGVQEYVNRSVPGFFAGYGSYGLGLPPLWLTSYLKIASLRPLDWLLPRLLRDKLAWCDAVITDFPFVHPVFAARAARATLRILNTHNVEHHLYDPNAGWRNRALRRAVERIELEAARHADAVVSCSAEDQAFFERSASVRRAVVVPNGIDLERFSMPPDVRRDTRAALGIAESVLLVLFTASKWGPNQEAFDFLYSFVLTHERELVESRIHFLVVGGVVDSPLRLPALTATGKVDTVEAYFAAADVGINPIVSGAGTNVKMGEFMAARLPVLVTPFGARGYRIEHGRTGFVFDRDHLMRALLDLRRMIDAAPEGLRAIADQALRENMSVISMVECVAPLVEIIRARGAKAADPRERKGRDRVAQA